MNQRLVAAVCAFAPLLAAAATQNLTVGANVQAVCQFQNAAGNLSYTIDPSTVSGSLNTQSVTIQYKCTKKSTAPAFTVGASNSGTYSGTLSNGSGGTLAYSLTWNPALVVAPSGFSGAAVSVPVTFNITQAAAQDAEAGTYAPQSIAIDINP